MLNAIFLVLVAGAVITAAASGTMAATNQAALEAAKSSVVELAIPLIGAMALWLGFMRVLRDAGFMSAIARGLAPLMRRLFPDIPAEHPAMGAMVLNLSANMLGLGNAATPFGLKAMRELDRLNPHPGISTNAMSLFLAINTAGVAVLPLGVIAVRTSLGSTNPAGILLPTLLATAGSTLTAIAVAKLLEKRKLFAPEKYEASARADAAPEIEGMAAAQELAALAAPLDPWRGFAVALFWFALALFGFLHVRSSVEASGFELVKQMLGEWLLPLLMAAIVTYGFAHKVKIYESFIAGAREAFEIATMIIPFLVAILVSVAMFRASGALGFITGLVAPVTSLVGFPAEALPMALIRPLSGSGGLGVMVETMKAHGTDSFVGFLVSVINGSVETTFYVIALYFGSVRVRVARHTVIACLAADFAGVVGALVWSSVFY